MLGNDVVDLQQATLASNWRRKGYLDKIFSVEEQRLIFLSETPDLLVWLFWSMKEAAYKIVNRQTGDRFYAPQRLLCHLDDFQIDQATGKVYFGEDIFFTQSTIDENTIHTVALTDPNDFKNISTHRLPNIDDYLSAFNAKTTNYFLEKNNNGLPEVTNKQTLKKDAASISHHGGHLAIVYRITK